MMLFLLVDVPGDLRNLIFAQRKNSVSFLPMQFELRLDFPVYAK